MVYLKKDFLNHINSVKPEGFRILDGHAIFQKKESNRELQIHLATREYFPHGAYIFGSMGNIIFEEVEKELIPLYRAERVKNSTNYTIKNSLVNIEGIDYKLLDQEINNDSTFAKISGELQKLIAAALAFFDQYNTIEEVANLLADKEPKEIVPFIQGAILLPKAILILKLAGHPKFQEKRDEFYELIKKQAAKKEQAQAHLKVFEKLFIK
ncbi:hypothetical protein AB9P05_24305 [Roseivirga sp. BDSF3-8]|uniref:hypothetical protein n=1 Tax=Roseivirga sp. BDSF3-8 TaxID=3241598 RepID=UPI0035325D72